MATELERLKEEQKKLKAKIKALEESDRYIRVGKARLGYNHYSGAAKDHYSIFVTCVPIQGMSRDRGIVQGETKEELLPKLQEVISDLQGLYELIKGDKCKDGN